MRLRLFYSVLLLLLLWGCAGIKPPEKPLPAAGMIESLKGAAVVTMKRGAIPLSGKAVVLAKSPDKFRIEVFGPFSQTMALMASDGENFSVFSGSEVKRYRWDDPEFPYPFDAKEVVSFLLGSRRTAIKDSLAEISKDDEGRITKYVRFKNGAPALTVLLSDYRAVAGSEIPFNILIKNEKVHLSIKYSEVEANPEIAPDAFILEPAS